MYWADKSTPTLTAFPFPSLLEDHGHSRLEVTSVPFHYLPDLLVLRRLSYLTLPILHYFLVTLVTFVT